MADKFIYMNAGILTELEATVTSAGAGNAGDIVALDGSGKLDSTLMPAGLGSDSKSLTAGEALSAGDLVYINGSGQMLKADANAIAKAAVGQRLAVGIRLVIDPGFGVVLLEKAQGFLGAVAIVGLRGCRVRADFPTSTM